MLKKFNPIYQVQRALVFLFLVVLTVLISPILISQLLIEEWNRKSKKSTDQFNDESEKLSKNHLEEKLSLDDIEAREYVYDPLNAVPHLPFGHNNSSWMKFKFNLDEGDELWSFLAVIKNGFGQDEKQKGYAILRNSEIQSCYFTERSVITEPHSVSQPTKVHRWWQFSKLDVS
jgi:hypothetical protein